MERKPCVFTSFRGQLELLNCISRICEGSELAALHRLGGWCWTSPRPVPDHPTSRGSRSRLGLPLEQPRDGGWVDLEEAGSGGSGPISFRNHLSNFGLLLRGELGAASPDAALLTGGIDSGLSAFPQHGALGLREGPHHLHHHPAGRSGRVDRLGQATESRAGFRELLHDREHVAQRA